MHGDRGPAGSPLQDFGQAPALVRGLIAVCREQVLAEKWVLAPSLRLGQQWLDAAARWGQPLLNARVVTLRTVALDLAAPELERRGQRLLRGVEGLVLVGELFAWLRQRTGAYLAALDPSPGLLRTLHRAITDLRLSGVRSAALSGRSFEVALKGRELRLLLARYEGELERRRLVDGAAVLHLARERLTLDPGALPGGALLLAPADLGLERLELALWQAVPPAQRRELAVDGPPARDDPAITDLQVLSGLLDPGAASSPRGDGTVTLLSAVGEANEVREVLRRCVEQGVPLDEVEILHTDEATYVPLLFELAAPLAPDGAALPPVTFAEGLPVRLFRPGRALISWIEWWRGGLPAATVVQMIEDGLLQPPGMAPGSWSFSRLGALLRGLGIGAGGQRTLTVLERARERWGRGGEVAAAPDGLLEGLGWLHELLAGLLDLVPEVEASDLQILEGTAGFLERYARCASQLDEYARRALRRDIEELRACLAGDEELTARGTLGVDPWSWLARLSRETRVGGMGPRPGALHVAPLGAGGHTGRRHTFIVGLDEGRFPGSGAQDPLLLDSERRRIAPDLPRAGEIQARRLEAFARLLARLRGRLTLSYPCHDLRDDRELFPSSVVLTAYRLLTGDREGEAVALRRALPPPASFAPASPGRALPGGDWWLWRLCAAGPVPDPDRLLAPFFPHLERGRRAGLARASDRFTAYDGHVPEAGAALDPARPAGMVLSASALETLGRCPLAFFLGHVLELRPLAEDTLDPERWLTPAQRGALIHETFHRFMSRLRRRARRAAFPGDEQQLLAILQQGIERTRTRSVPPDEAVYAREVAELQETARIFLREEAARVSERLPFLFEVSVGMPPVGQGTALDVVDPATMILPDGQRVRVRGRIDRLDEIPDRPLREFEVWDYKSGSSARFQEGDPWRGGRLVQSALYLWLAEERVRAAVSREARVTAFGYLFPSPQERGHRVSWSAAELRGGGAMIGRLCRMIAAGCFPFSDDPDDVRRSDLGPALGEARTAARQLRRKLDGQAAPALAPFRQLRAGGEEEAPSSSGPPSPTEGGDV